MMKSWMARQTFVVYENNTGKIWELTPSKTWVRAHKIKPGQRLQLGTDITRSQLNVHISRGNAKELVAGNLTGTITSAVGLARLEAALGSTKV